MPQLLLINPRRRRKAKKSHRRSRRARRPMTALQKKYFGGGRRRRAGLSANPRRRRRSVTRSAPRRRQRGFARAGGLRIPRVSFNMGALQSAAKTAVIGASGAIAVDVLMGQAVRVLPDGWASRFNAEGGVNWPYYLTKAGLAVAVGTLVPKVARGFGGVAQQAAIGALTVQGYELLRAFIPADIVTMGYYSPARIAGMRGRLGLYQRAPSIGAPATSLGRLRGLQSLRGFGSVRVGEGNVR